MRAARVSRIVGCALLGAVACALPGCNWIGAFTYMVMGKDREVHYEAQYRGLEQKTGAVLVAAPPEIYSRYPNAVSNICAAVSSRLAERIPGGRFVEPGEVIKFQNANPYWTSEGYGDLIRRLKVDRLVYIDISGYQLSEEGNPHVLQGEVSAGVGVIEREQPQFDRFGFYTTLVSRFPEKSSLGVVNSDAQTIELGTLATFSQDVQNIFLDHTKIEKR
jgi:hypothetical protein